MRLPDVFGQRTYSRSVTIAVAVLAVEVAVGVPLIVDAAGTSGVASVEVVASPSTLGALSNFQIGVQRPASGSTVINVSPDNIQMQTASGQTDNGLGRMQPALFSISGIPDQTFSISVPQPGSATSKQGKVQFVSFEHNAGTTPTIGADGTAVFAVGAQVKFTEFLQLDLTMDTGPGGEPNISQADPNGTPAEKVGMPKVNPFGVQAVSNGFLNILVSYN
ncbi:DUF4402 domain-containing protein [Magnetovibrio sp.]|uniref:DUF4402 domain-containing protein n=1 Tax=Magnetovibrio sp. TaxID=2024836 RepID=UPI002F944080